MSKRDVFSLRQAGDTTGLFSQKSTDCKDQDFNTSVPFPHANLASRKKLFSNMFLANLSGGLVAWWPSG